MTAPAVHGLQYEACGEDLCYPLAGDRNRVVLGLRGHHILNY